MYLTTISWFDSKYGVQILKPSVPKHANTYPGIFSFFQFFCGQCISAEIIARIYSDTVNSNTIKDFQKFQNFQRASVPYTLLKKKRTFNLSIFPDDPGWG